MTIKMLERITIFTLCTLVWSQTEYSIQIPEPKDPIARYSYYVHPAKIRFLGGQFAQAIPLYQKALSLFPTKAQRIAAHVLMGNRDEWTNLGLCYILRHRSKVDPSRNLSNKDIQNAPLASQILALDCFVRANFSPPYFNLLENSPYQAILQNIYGWYLLRPTALAIHAGTWTNNTFFGSRKRCVASCVGLASIAALAYYRPWQNPALQTALQKVPAFLHACWQRLPWRAFTKSVAVSNITAGTALKLPALAR